MLYITVPDMNDTSSILIILIHGFNSPLAIDLAMVLFGAFTWYLSDIPPDIIILYIFQGVSGLFVRLAIFSPISPFCR